MDPGHQEKETSTQSNSYRNSNSRNYNRHNSKTNRNNRNYTTSITPEKKTIVFWIVLVGDWNAILDAKIDRVRREARESGSSRLSQQVLSGSPRVGDVNEAR